MLAMLLPATTLAHDFEVDGIYYKINGNEATVTYQGTIFNSMAYSGDVVIPESVTYNGTTYSVTAIGNFTFYKCSGLTSVSIPNSVTSIGINVFYECIGLTSVTIPNSVTSIGGGAFFSCSGLTSVTIPNSVITIGDDAFYGCSGLTSIFIPNSVTAIGYYAFYNCYELSDVYCFSKSPSSISLGNLVFYLEGEDYSGRTLHVLDNSSVYWYQEDTSWSQYFESIVESYFEVNGIYYSMLSESEVAVASSPYNNKYSGQIFIPETVAFEGRTFVVTTINKSAFYGCGGLTSVNIPNSVTSIGKYAFEDCISLSNINVASDNPVYDSRENCNAIIETASNTLIAGCNNTVIPHGIISIGYGAFRESGITSIVIPGSVHTIGEKAFMQCESLTDVTLSEGLLLIDEEAFSETEITEIQLPESLVRIVEQAFEETPLKSITLPKNVAFLGNEEDYEDDLYGGVFDYCYSLTEVNVDELNTTYASCDGILMTKDMKSLLYFPCGRTGECVIPNTVTTIYNDAFDGCRGLTSVTIPSAVTTIGDYAFWNCVNLSLVRCHAVTPPTIYNGTFKYNSYYGVLEVPEGSVDAYRSHVYWGLFQNIQPITEVSGDVDGDGNVTIGDVTNLIDKLLGGGVSVADYPAADVDSDGNITIGDVTRIIDMLLYGN